MAYKAKQVIIIRKDLNMRRGKEIAQGAHASMAPILGLIQDIKEYEFRIDGSRRECSLGEGEFWGGFFSTNKKAVWEWISGKFAKITCSVNSEAELLELYEKAKASGVLCSLIQDEGLTEFNGVKTYTAVAIGPDYSDVIDPITSHLKLY
jgi:PTH2 family peptidyl-tRNA hydrolase